jgi:hypothetical protein
MFVFQTDVENQVFVHEGLQDVKVLKSKLTII